MLPETEAPADEAPEDTVRPVRTWKAIATLRAVRVFKRRPVEPKRLAKILDAGRRAPSSMNAAAMGRSSWCASPTGWRRSATVGDYAGHLAKAPVAIAFVTADGSTDSERESIAFDLGQCVQSMLLAAWEMEIGGCHAAVYDEGEARRILELPDGKRCDYLISLGYPKTADRDGPPHGPRSTRRPLDELRHDETWPG